MSRTEWRLLFARTAQVYAEKMSETARDAVEHDCFDAAWWQLAAAREYESARRWRDGREA